MSERMPRPKDGWYAQRDRLRQRLDCDIRMSASARVIGGLLMSMCSPARPYAYPSIEQLAAATGFSRATVNRAIRQLKAFGYFKVRSGFIDFVDGGGYASHYRPVLSAANNFSLSDAFGPSVTSEPPPVSPVRLPSVTSDTLISDNESGSPALPSATAPVAAAPNNSASTMWDDFLRIFALAVEHSKQGDKPMEKTFEDYAEARGYPKVTAESLYAEYLKELAFWQGKRRNKADMLPRFLQNPRKFTGALSGSKPSATRKDRARQSPRDSKRPGANTGDTEAGAKARVLHYLGWTTAKVADAMRECEISCDTDAELDDTCRVLAGLRMTRGTVYDCRLPHGAKLLHHPDLTAERSAFAKMDWKEVATYLPKVAGAEL